MLPNDAGNELKISSSNSFIVLRSANWNKASNCGCRKVSVSAQHPNIGHDATLDALARALVRLLADAWRSENTPTVNVGKSDHCGIAGEALRRWEADHE